MAAPIVPPGFVKLDQTEHVDGLAAELATMVIEAVKEAGHKKFKIELEVSAELNDDGEIEVEVETEVKSDKVSEEKEYKYRIKA